MSTPTKFSEWRKAIAPVAAKHGFNSVAYVLGDVDYEGDAVAGAFEAWRAAQEEWKLAQAEGEVDPRDNFWTFAEGMVHDMLIDMDSEMSYYGYQPAFGSHDEEADHWDDWDDDDTQEDQNEASKAAHAVAYDLSRNAHPTNESLKRLVEAPTGDVRIGELYADIAGDRDYATILNVTVDPSTGNVTLELTDRSPGGGMDMRAGQVTSSRTSQVGRPDARQLMAAIRDAINKDDILKHYGKPRKNFKWFANGQEIGRGMSQKFAKQALLSVHDPEKYTKKYVPKSKPSGVSPEVEDIVRTIVDMSDGDFRGTFDDATGEVTVKGYEIAYFFSDYASETAGYVGDLGDGWSEYETRNGGFAWKKIGSNVIKLKGV